MRNAECGIRNFVRRRKLQKRGGIVSDHTVCVSQVPTVPIILNIYIGVPGFQKKEIYVCAKKAGTEGTEGTEGTVIQKRERAAQIFNFQFLIFNF